jgi:hypothetical protein
VITVAITSNTVGTGIRALYVQVLETNLTRSQTGQATQSWNLNTLSLS